MPRPSRQRLASVASASSAPKRCPLRGCMDSLSQSAPAPPRPPPPIEPQSARCPGSAESSTVGLLQARAVPCALSQSFGDALAKDTRAERSGVASPPLREESPACKPLQRRGAGRDRDRPPSDSARPRPRARGSIPARKSTARAPAPARPSSAAPATEPFPYAIPARPVVFAQNCCPE
jgi:hypothetical protein